MCMVFYVMVHFFDIYTFFSKNRVFVFFVVFFQVFLCFGA